MIITHSSFLNNVGDDIVFGHNGGTGTTNTFLTDIPTVRHRWSREWALLKTDVNSNGGNVQIRFDFSDAGRTTAPFADASLYRLIKRTDSSSNFEIVATASSVSGDQVIFDNVNVNALGSLFTLGTTQDSLGPNAVELQSFSARNASHVNGVVLPPVLVILGGTAAVLMWWACQRGDLFRP
jgi:hypothetical protein